MANTLEKAQIEKLSNVSEKGDDFFRVYLKNFFAAAGISYKGGVAVYKILDTVYNFTK